MARRSTRPSTAPDSSATILDDEDELVDHVAELLDEGKVVGWFQGRMEFGPRAWGREAFWATRGGPRCSRG